jgi:hypothetical protein
MAEAKIIDRAQKFIVSYINDGKGASYPSGADLDLSHGATSTSTCSYTKSRTGLYFVKCVVCGAEAQFITPGNGIIKLACKINTSADAF